MYAVAMPVTALVTPGPEVTRATPTFSVERDDRTSRLAVIDVADAWPRRLVVDDGAVGDEWSTAVSPDGRSVAYVFWLREDLRESRIRVVDVEAGTGTTTSPSTAPPR